MDTLGRAAIPFDTNLSFPPSSGCNTGDRCARRSPALPISLLAIPIYPLTSSTSFLFLSLLFFLSNLLFSLSRFSFHRGVRSLSSDTIFILLLQMSLVRSWEKCLQEIIEILFCSLFTFQNFSSLCEKNFFIKHFYVLLWFRKDLSIRSRNYIRSNLAPFELANVP